MAEPAAIPGHVPPGAVQAFLTKPYTAQDLLVKLHLVLQAE